MKIAAWHLDTGDDASWCESGEQVPQRIADEVQRPMVYLDDALAAVTAANCGRFAGAKKEPT